MASLLQIASQLAERAGRKNDITFIKQMKDLTIFKRATILANSLGKNPALDKLYLSYFHVDLKKVDATDECSDEEIACADKVYKSVVPVPEPLKYGVHPFNYVGAPGGAKAYGWTTFGNEPYYQLDPFTGKFARHTYIDSYIYVFNKEIDEIRVEGVFGDPRKLAAFKSCNGAKPCWTDEQETAIDERLAELIIKDITGELRFNIPDEPVQIKVDKDV